MTAALRAAPVRAGSRIVSTGSYRPARVIDNHEVVTWIESTDEWIRERTGIRDAERAARGPRQRTQVGPTPEGDTQIACDRPDIRPRRAAQAGRAPARQAPRQHEEEARPRDDRDDQRRHGPRAERQVQIGPVCDHRDDEKPPPQASSKIRQPEPSRTREGHQR